MLHSKEESSRERGRGKKPKSLREYGKIEGYREIEREFQKKHFKIQDVEGENEKMRKKEKEEEEYIYIYIWRERRET